MKRILLIKALLLTHLISFAIDVSNIKFDHLTVDDGLSQNTIEKLFQDSQGYIWIGTRDGLNKYDGSKFQIYRNERGDTNSLASSWVSSIAEDAEGNIWIGSDGLNIYNPKLDKLIRVKISDNENSYHGGRVYDILLDYDNTVWLATAVGLVHYFPETGIYKTYSETFTPENQATNLVFSVMLSSDNRLFVASETDPIYEFSRETGKLIEHNYKLAYYGNNFKKNIQEGFNGLLYIGSEGAAVHVYNPTTKECYLIDVSEGGLNALTIKTRVLPISETEVFIGTDGGGINIFNPLDKTCTYLKSNPANPYSLGENAIFSMLSDRDGNIWVGHYGAGISLWKKYKYKFQSYFHNAFDPTTMSSGVVLSSFQDSKGRIWIGLDGGGLSQFDIITQTFKRFKHIDGEPTSLSSDVIVCINETESGYLLLGTYAGGLMLFDPDKGEVVKTYRNDEGVGSENIWKITKDSRGMFWNATLGGGYDIFNPKTETFTNKIWGQDEDVCSNVIFTIDEGPDGKIWFGTENNGICVFDQENGTNKRYKFDENNTNSLSSNSIRSIVFQNNYAWIATSGGGLNRLDIRKDSFKVYTTKDGLTSNALMGILKDRKGMLWISSTKGLMKFNPQSEMVIAYDKSQGLQGNEFKYNSQFELNDGRMLFGGANGLTLFNPEEINVSPIIPSVVFTNLLIYNTPVEVGAKGSPLQEHINNSTHLKLKHKDRVFTIEFASLDFTSPTKNQYKYILEGFDEDWVNIGNRKFVSYTNLNPGKYTLRLKGSNSDGAWNDEERVLYINIRPPWYKTFVFILFVILLLIFGTWGFVKERVRQAKAEKIALQKKIDEGQAVIDAKLGEIEKQQEELKLRDAREMEIRFQTDGLAKFSGIISQSRSNIKNLAQNLIAELVTYLDASIGVIYVADTDSESRTILKVYGQYCFDSEVESKESILAGVGYVGTCFNQKGTIINDDLPDGFIQLSSGLGTLSVKYSVLEPIVEESEPMGVIEIASLEKLEDYKIEFIRKIAQTFGSVLAIEYANNKTKELLEANKKQTEEILSHEEELRQNLEELQATQEMSERREEQLLRDNENKEAKILELKELLNKK